MDRCESDHSAGIASGKGDVVISGADTKVSAHGGYSRGDAFGIEAVNGNVVIADATVRASAIYSGTDGAVGIRASGETADAGNIVICGADVAAAGEAQAVSLTGSLTVAPAEGMQAAVRTHDEVLEDDWSTPDPDWDGMAAASTAIEGSPFASETTLDPALLEGARYLSVSDEQAEEPEEPLGPDDTSDPDDPGDSSDGGGPDDPSNPDDPGDPSDGDDSDDEGSPDPVEPAGEGSDATPIPATGDASRTPQLAAGCCLALAGGILALRRRLDG